MAKQYKEKPFKLRRMLCEWRGEHQKVYLYKYYCSTCYQSLTAEGKALGYELEP